MEASWTQRLGGAGLAGSLRAGVEKAAHAMGKGLLQRHWHQKETGLAEIQLQLSTHWICEVPHFFFFNSSVLKAVSKPTQRIKL